MIFNVIKISTEAWPNETILTNIEMLIKIWDQKWQSSMDHVASKITISDTMITILNVGSKVTITNTMITKSHAGSKITITYT